MSDFMESITSEKEDRESDFVVYKINSYPADYTLQGLYDKWNSKEIRIEDFQRGFVWTELQQSKLIESFLLGLPVPNIFFYRDEKNQELVIIDGQQRLRTVFSYFKGIHMGSEKVFRLKMGKAGSEMKKVNPKWLDKSFEELDRVDQIKLRDSILRAVIVEQIDPEDNTSIVHIFERLNTGGTPLKLQEIRNSLYQGVFNDLLKALNDYEIWRKIIGRPTKDKRMRDIELILRFLALFHEHDGYEKPMKDFLSKFMEKYRNDESASKRFQMIFRETIDAVYEHLGPKCFRLKDGSGLNVAVLDSVMVAFALNLGKIPSDIKSRYNRLREISNFIDDVSGGTTSKNAVERRISLSIKELFGS